MLNTMHRIRSAQPEDAQHIARLTNIAGEGMAHYNWVRLAGENDDPWEIGTERARRNTGPASGSTLMTVDGEVAGLLMVYPITEAAKPESYDDMPGLFVPLQKLEDMAVGSFHVHVLALYPQYRGLGLGRRLLRRADDLAGGKPLSLIVSDANHRALGLYESHGYRQRASLPAVHEGWDNPVKNWLLMWKDA